MYEVVATEDIIKAMERKMSTTVSRKAFFIPFVLITLLISSFSHGFVAANSAQSKIILTTDIASSENQEIFSPYDTIYTLVTLTGITPGKYTADISWANEKQPFYEYHDREDLFR